MVQPKKKTPFVYKFSARQIKVREGSLATKLGEVLETQS